MSVANLFESLTAGVTGLESQQAALAVQALLESQSIPEATTVVEDDDVFQCGKCKKQFNNLSAFISHKQTQCTGTVVATVSRGHVVSQHGGLVQSTASKQQTLSSFATISSSPLAQALGHNIVLTEDMMTFATPVDQTLPSSTLQVGSNPFLSQLSPGTSRNTVAPQTIIVTSTGSSGFSASSNSAFTTLPGQLQLQGLPTVLAQGPSGGATMLTAASPEQDGVETQVILQTSGASAILSPIATMAPSNSLTSLVSTSSTRPLSFPNILRPGMSKSCKLTGLAPATGQITVITEAGELSLAAPTPQVAGPAQTPTQGPKVRRTKPVAEKPGTKWKLKCQYCDKTFAKNFDLMQHVRSHTGEKPFQCIVCGRAFAQKSNVKKHMQTHKVWPQGTGKTLPNQPSPKIISEKETGPEAPPEEQVHEVEQTDEAVVEMDNDSIALDEAATTIEVNLNTRKESKDGKEEAVWMNVVIDSSYVCQYCPLKFRSYFQLKSHMTTHKEEQVYKCILKTCSQTFKELDHFLEHTKAHEENMSYRCHLCSKMFPSLYELGVHQYSHSLYPNQGPKPRPRYYRCVKCSSKYSTPEALQHHLDSVSHKHQCPHCYKLFTCERYLRRHLPIHGSVGDHQCEVCDKLFKTEHYLKVHQLIHTDDKPFACEQCPAAFNRKDKLKRHLLVHETNRRYKCPFWSHIGCTMAFNRPDKLKAHIICHSGIKPYKCKECGKSFTRRPNLRQHERGHRKDYSHSCAKCGKGFLRERLFKMHKCRLPVPPARDKTDGDQASEESTNQTVAEQIKSNASDRRKKLITVVRPRRSYRNQTSRRGRPRKYSRPDVKPRLQELTPILSPATSFPQQLTGYSETADVHTTEVSLVVGEDSSGHHYVTSQDHEATMVTGDNLVVIQPLSAVPHGAYQTDSGQDPPAYGDMDDNMAALSQKAQVYTTALSQDMSGMEATDIPTSYSLEPYTPQSQQQDLYADSGQGYQQATLIATGPNMATLVVEGPSGEVITQEGITTIVGQDGEQYASPNSYSVLQYSIQPQECRSEEVSGIETQTLTVTDGQTVLKAES